MVFYCPFVDGSVVLDRAQLSVFLFDKEEGGGIGTFRWLDGSSHYMFLDELLQFFQFDL